MQLAGKIKHKKNQLKIYRFITDFRIVLFYILFAGMLVSCQTDPYGSNWVDEENISIYQFLENHRNEYSKFYVLLDKGQMLKALSAYNPYGNGYTLFVPTNEAIDNYIGQSSKYSTFDELIKDTAFVKTLTRYHTVKRMVHTDEFPEGALLDSTLTGDRLAIGFSMEGDDQRISVNHIAPIIESNLKMSNGYINIISGVLQRSEISGYEWIQQNEGYTILAEAMKLTGMKNRLWWSKYTILAEHDSIYNRMGIYNVSDLIKRIGTPGLAYPSRSNNFYQFTAYHFLGGELFMNDFSWGNKKYVTLSNYQINIDTGLEIKISPGIDFYRTSNPETGEIDTINYIRPIWRDCNLVTSTGPIHSITDVLYFEPFPKN